MDLVALTYISRSAPDQTPQDVDAIHRAALTYNPLDGITGLLIYNGNGFMQIIEGAESAINDLMTRIAADIRHLDLEIRDRRSVKRRCFPHWTMHRVDVSATFERGLAAMVHAVEKIDAPMRAVIGDSLAAISTPPTPVAATP